VINKTRSKRVRYFFIGGTKVINSPYAYYCHGPCRRGKFMELKSIPDKIVI
jgi:hypothetical protein